MIMRLPSSLLTLNRLCFRGDNMNIKIDIIDIDWIHAIEKELDKSMVKLGFTRTETSKNEKDTEFKYRQFGVCQG